MLAKDYIEERVKKAYREQATVIAHIDDETWWHVHWDEEVPVDFPVYRVSIRIKG